VQDLEIGLHLVKDSDFGKVSWLKQQIRSKVFNYQNSPPTIVAFRPTDDGAATNPNLGEVDPLEGSTSVAKVTFIVEDPKST